jgi:hypothetical protein
MHVCVCVYDLPTAIINLQADGTIIIISHPEIDLFQSCINYAFASSKKWFKTKQLKLSFDKTNVMKFCATPKLVLI